MSEFLPLLFRDLRKAWTHSCCTESPNAPEEINGCFWVALILPIKRQRKRREVVSGRADQVCRRLRQKLSSRVSSAGSRWVQLELWAPPRNIHREPVGSGGGY